MPGMNGYELVEKASHINPALKVLMVSGYDDKKVDQDLPAGITLRRMRKPYTIDLLLNNVKQLCSEDALAD
jgi:CheY-like chemotaxis protein